MQVREIMTRGVEMIDLDSKICQAAEKMRSLNVGSLPVCEGDSIVGMLTDRDITIRAVADCKDPSQTSVSEVMTQGIIFCYEDDYIDDAARMMEDKGIYRLLVLNNENEPCGFLSVCDFAVKSQDEHLTWEVVEKISEPACPSRRSL